MEIKFIGEVAIKQLSLGLEIIGNSVQSTVHAVRKRFRRYQPDTQMVMWQVPENVLPEDHLAFFVCELIAKLDLSEFLAPYKGGGGRGQPPYDLLMMVRLLTYCYCKGIESSRAIEEATYDDIGCRMITDDQHPDHTTISNFRQRHLAALANLFDQSVRQCMDAGLVDLKNTAVDGTKIKANASKHHAMSYDRMCTTSAKYEREIPEIKAEIEALSREDATSARNARLAERKEDLRIRQKRLPVIQESKVALEEEARCKAALEESAKQQASKTNKQGRKRKKEQTGEPASKAQRNFTDSDSKIMPSKKTFLQGYNAQVAADGKTQIIVGHDVVQATNDKQQLLPMARQIHARFGRLPDNLLADSGFFSEENIRSEVWKQLGPTNLLIPPGKEKKGKKQSAPIGRIPKNATVADLMRRKLRTKPGHAAYRLRKCIVEPVIGQIKDSVLDFEEFKLRGLQKVKQEFGFVCTIHNLMKLYRHGWNSVPAPS